MAFLVDLLETAQDRPVLALGVVGVLLAVIIKVLTPGHNYPDNLPWVGKDDSKVFANVRATLASAYNVKFMLAEGYQKVSLSATCVVHVEFRY